MTFWLRRGTLSSISTGDGVIHIQPQPIQASAELVFGTDMIEPKISREYDWYGCPNVFRATSGDDSAIAIDDSDSEISVLSRGREIWAEDTSCNLKDGETLYEYASRRLKEEQMVAKRVSYSRRYNPDILVGDIIRLNYPQAQGAYFVLSQSIDLGYGLTTNEEVVK